MPSNAYHRISPARFNISKCCSYAASVLFRSPRFNLPLANSRARASFGFVGSGGWPNVTANGFNFRFGFFISIPPRRPAHRIQLLRFKCAKRRYASQPVKCFPQSAPTGRGFPRDDRSTCFPVLRLMRVTVRTFQAVFQSPFSTARFPRTVRCVFFRLSLFHPSKRQPLLHWIKFGSVLGINGYPFFLLRHFMPLSKVNRSNRLRRLEFQLERQALFSSGQTHIQTQPLGRCTIRRCHRTRKAFSRILAG